MPKQYDTSRNYYADLELPPNATCDDARKSYRKLVLKYHPDRNIGNEDEAVPKFQAVQAAHEILSDPEQKNKYDQDRARMGMQGRGNVPRAQTYGNPYQASTAYPPPPRRTQPGTWQRPSPASAYTGADRFSNFPRQAPTAKQRPDSAQDRTNMFQAWQNMNTGSGQSPRSNPATAASGATPTKPRPPPRKGPSRMPNEEEIRAGMNYKAPPQSFDRAEEKQSAWSAFQQANPAKASKAGKATKAGVNRAQSTRTPKKAGFDPNAPGSDERPAPGSSNYARHRSEDFGRAPQFQPTSDGAGPPPPNASPAPPPQGHQQRPHADPLHPYTSRDVPYHEGNRQRTPYQSFMNDRVDHGADNLRRSFSQRDNASMNQNISDDEDRPRSTSPRSHSRHSSGAHRGFSSDGPRPPFVVYSSSEDSSDMEPERFSSSSEPSSAGGSKDPSANPTPDPTSSRPSPVISNPNDRPKKQPSSPSKRVNSPFTVPDPPSSVFTTDNNRPQSGSETQPMQQKSSNNMYVKLDHDPPMHPPFRSSEWAERMFGSSQHSTFEKGEQSRKLSIPKWAIPSSLSPRYEKSKKEGNFGNTNVTDENKAASVNTTCFYKETGSLNPSATPLGKHLDSCPESHWANATDEEKYAFFAVQNKLQTVPGSVAKDFNMEVFLRLASTVRLGKSSGNLTLDQVFRCSLAPYPRVGFRVHSEANADNNNHSFSFPINNDTFKTSAARARSEESINTRFTEGDWTGHFTGSTDAFSPPPSAGPTRKPHSPASRTRARQANRAATSPFASTPPLGSRAPNFGGTSMPPPPPPPPRPTNTEGAPLEGSQSAPQGAPGFNEQNWAKQFKEPNWAMPPPPPPPGPPSQPASRAQSRPGSRGPPRRGFSADEANTNSRQRSFTAHDGSQVVVEEELGGTPSPDQGDAMDIDDMPPAPSTEQQNGAIPTETQSQPITDDKVPEMVSVPPAPWRQQQASLNGAHARTASAPKPEAPKLYASLEDLGDVEPLARSAAEGLRNFKDLSASLPFTSQPSATIPIHSAEPGTMQMPPVPRAPAPPAKLSKANWHSYAGAFGKYLRAFHIFNATMLMQFQTRQVYAERQISGNMDWLEATGDTVGNGSNSGAGGFGKYMKDVREDEKMRETWRIGCERHSQAVTQFDQTREKVRRSVIGGIFPDV